jgi:PHD/YefM family antitoxin component YafN of YafNO toxin-antitoxin module
MPGDSTFQSLNLAKVQGELQDLYRKVAAEKSRVEIVSGDGSSDCVLISKAELQSLERAIDVLADSEAVRELSAQLAQIMQPQLQSYE